MTASGPQDSPRAITILVVDDEPSVLALVRTMLWRAGYAVLEASGAAEALQVVAGREAPLHLLVTDILMPDMNGYELAEKIKALRPEMKIVYMSGYRDKVLLESTGRSLADAPLIRKPFTQHNLIAKISEVLDVGDPSPVQ
jgi:two-component system, cell cycle sensor histidine kinase and response regulator CckA